MQKSVHGFRIDRVRNIERTRFDQHIPLVFGRFDAESAHPRYMLKDGRAEPALVFFHSLHKPHFHILDFLRLVLIRRIIVAFRVFPFFLYGFRLLACDRHFLLFARCTPDKVIQIEHKHRRAGRMRNRLTGNPVRVVRIPAHAVIDRFTQRRRASAHRVPRHCVRVIRCAGTHDDHALDGVEQQFDRFRTGQAGHTSDAECQMARCNTEHRLVYAGEHVAVDDLKRPVGAGRVHTVRFFRSLAFQFVFDLLFGSGQVTRDLRDAVIVHQSADAVTALRQIFLFKIGVQFFIKNTHRDLARAVIVFIVESRP